MKDVSLARALQLPGPCRWLCDTIASFVLGGALGKDSIGFVSES